MQGNRLANPGAESANTQSWTGDGFAASRYGSGETPSEQEARDRNYGQYLFVSEKAGGTLTQTMDLSDLSASIDAGQQLLTFGGAFGGKQQTDGSAAMLVELLDAQGAVASSREVGGPARADRNDESALLTCIQAIVASPGVRAARVTLSARTGSGSGVAFADALFFTDQAYAFPTAAERSGAGCAPFTPSAAGSADDTDAREVLRFVAAPSRHACRRDRRLVFKLRKARLDEVRSVQVKIGGRAQRARAGSITLRVRRRVVSVWVVVRLRDTRRISATLSFRSCRLSPAAG